MMQPDDNAPQALAFPTGRYGVVLADPPWSFAVRSPKGKERSAERHYGVMDLAAIKALPVRDVANDDCVLFLWATDPLLPQALEVMAAWGFAYKTIAFTWAKTTASGKWHMGCGYWTRANPEMCLLGTRGRPRRLSRGVRQLIVAPRREHSRKPDRLNADIQLLTDGPYLELFARSTVPGWTCWGLETDRFGGSS